MSSEKFEAINRFIRVTSSLRDGLLGAGDMLADGLTDEEILRRHLADRLEVVRAAQAVTAAPKDPEADSIAGAVLLDRIDRATTSHPVEAWEARAEGALLVFDENTDEAHEKIRAWMSASQPIIDLGFEALERAQQQSHDAMIEGLRRGAEQSPGVSLRISETVGDTLVSDETVYGPESGHEDGAGHSVGYVSSMVEGILGIDDDRMEPDVENLIRPQIQLVLDRNNLPASAGEDQVRLTVRDRVMSKAINDLDIVRVTGDLPSPLAGLEARHFPALRAQLMLQHNLPLSEGAVLSRAQRGDRRAQGVLVQLVLLSDMLSRAEPYFLRLDQMQTPAQDEGRSLPASQSFLVWHDTALHVGKGVDVLAWLFTTDEQGSVHPVAHTIRLHQDGALETSWCSLRQGQAAPTANQIVRSLRRADWDTARPLRLPKPTGGKEWKKALARSAARLGEGGLHSLRTLPR